jgi:tRNA(adenine34) deaminase
MMISPPMDDCSLMKIALEEAEIAAKENEVPIGAVLVLGTRIYRDHNRTIQRSDPTAHAEVEVIRKSAKELGNYRLNGSTLYITIEPCLMCVGAIVHARISRLVYAASDERYGAVESLIKAFGLGLNHKPEVQSGILADESTNIIRKFFQTKRKGEVPKWL